MKRALLVTSLVCSALVGCGDDGKTTGDTVTPTTPPGGEESTGGNGETVGVSSATEPEQPTTTSVMGTETNDPSNTTPPPAESSGGSFLVEIDGVIDENQCNPFTQDCPEGEKCQPWADDGGGSWNNDKCVPVTGDGQPGDACFAEGGGTAGIDDCGPGVFCWDVDAEGNGVCVELCKGSMEAGTCDDPDKGCAVYNEGTLPLCLDGCDPLSQNCDPSDVCIGNPNGEGFLCVLDASGDEGQQHDPCNFANACDPGLLCNDPTAANECDPNAMGCCEPFCDLTDPMADMNCGGEGQVCNPYFEEGTAPPDYVNVGYCAIPM